MIEMLCGMAGAVLLIAVFLAGFYFGSKTVNGPAELEMLRAKKEREELIAEQEAFRSLLEYNTDTAYRTSGAGINNEG